MNKVGWIIFSVVVILLLGGLVAWARITNPPLDVSSFKNNTVIAAAEQNGSIADHTRGSEKNEILLIEYGDFQCPSCQAADPNVKALIDEYSDDVTLVFRNFPITSIHPNAKAAAAAAEAAGLQGKYWEMHSLLYSNQDQWGNANAEERLTVFTGYALDLDLDTGKFKTDLASENVAKKITFDQAIAKTANVEATPTFFLNGEQLDSETASGIVQGDLTKIKEQLDALIK